jgi:hypothetical protein
MYTKLVFPKLKSDDDFEDLIHDLYSRILNNRNLQRYGKKGQKQHGVDIAGICDSKVNGIQCKNHTDPGSKITEKEINDEIIKSDSFLPRLDNYLIVTSAEKDKKITSYVLEKCKERIRVGKHPIYIRFWDDILKDLSTYPDLIYKYFTKYFPILELEVIHQPKRKLGAKTLGLPIQKKALLKNVKNQFKGLQQTEPYNLSVGITSFDNIFFDKLVDIQLKLETSKDSHNDFLKTVDKLKKLQSIFEDQNFSNNLTFYLQTRINYAFILGWLFRKVTKFNLTLIFGDQVWATNGLPFTKSRLIENLPIILNKDSNEIVLTLNISRNISLSVNEWVEKLSNKPKAILNYSVEGNSITNAAHALSIAQEISWKLKNLIDTWRVKKIHLFSAMPAALGTLIGYHLNAICPINLYFLDESRSIYKLGGEINNSL